MFVCLLFFFPDLKEWCAHSSTVVVYMTGRCSEMYEFINFTVTNGTVITNSGSLDNIV